MTGKCQKKGCFRDATHALKLCAPGETHFAPTREAVIGLELCKPCIDAVDVKDFIESAPAILQMLGLEKGEEDLVYPDGILLTSAEFAAFKAMLQPTKAN